MRRRTKYSAAATFARNVLPARSWRVENAEFMLSDASIRIVIR